MDSPLLVQGGFSVMTLNDRTRNNRAKFIVKHFNPSVARLLANKNTNNLECLANEVVSSRTANSFKNHLDKHWTKNPPDVRVNW